MKAQDPRDPCCPGFQEAEQLALVRELNMQSPPLARWRAEENTMFGPRDGAMLRGVLLHYRPQRFVEVGSGFSTAIALDVRDNGLPDLAITCVEPYSDRLRSLLRPGDDLTIIETPVQALAPDELAAGLAPGDVLFIDSTHVVKAGSDVCHLLLHVLPQLPVGVLVHVHDVFWPFEYPDRWLIEGRDWTESYLLHAFLLHNGAWKIRLFGSWLWQEQRESMPDIPGEQPGSIWLQRVA